MRIPILAAVGLVLALVGVLGYTVIFPTMMSISGQDFVSQASEDANNNQNFKDYDSGDKVIIVDEVVRMQYGYDGEKATSVWVESIGKSDQSIRFVCDSNYMNDIWSFDLKQMTWKELIASGEYPERRSNHTCNFYEPKNS